MNNERRLKLSLQTKKVITGLIFIFPFIVGFILFFLRPSIQSVIFSLSDLQIKATGYELNFIGFENYKYAFTVDPQFTRIFTETVRQILVDIPAVIIFSFIAAAFLNQDFKGRGLARVIFFLPVILGAGVLAQLEKADIMARTQGLQYGTGIEAGINEVADVFLFSTKLTSFFLRMRLPKDLLNYIVVATAHIPDIIHKSAIPIVIFLAGLQSISSLIYEAADIEGANGWEKFWKITVPLISPLIVTNIVFIIIDSFTAADNRLVTYIESTAWGRGIFGVSVAMSWVYFLAITIILAVVIKIVSKYSFSME